MKTQLTRVLPFVILLLLWLVACTAAPQPAPAASAEPLKVSWNLWPGNYPLVIGHELGLFEKYGVQVEPVFSAAYSTIISDFAARKLDGAAFVLGDLVTIADQTDVKAVLVLDISDGADQVLATADIATPAYLRGKRVGASLGTFSELFVRTMLEANGLTVNDVTLVDLDGETVLAEMPGAIQAGHTWEPHTSQGVTQGYHVIFSTADTPGLISDVLAFHTAVVEQRPEEIQAYIAAWFEALEWWQAHPVEGKAIIAEAIGLKPEEISSEGVKFPSYEENLRAFFPGTDHTSVYFSAQSYLEFFIRIGVLTTAPNIEELFEPSFVRAYSQGQ